MAERKERRKIEKDLDKIVDREKKIEDNLERLVDRQDETNEILDKVLEKNPPLEVEFPEFPEIIVPEIVMPEVQTVKIEGVELIKGEEGDKGEIGPKGNKGDKGGQGEKGDKGDKGDKGEIGPRGPEGRFGKDGKDGNDGAPDTPDEVRDKLETLEGEDRLDSSAIKNLPEGVRQIVRQSGGGGGGGGSNGANIGSGEGLVFATRTDAGTLQFRSLLAGTNMTITNNASDITFDAAGGGATSPWETDSNVVNLVTETDTVTIGSSTAGGKLFIDGDANEIQLQVQAHSTNTAQLAVFEDSSGNDQITFAANGKTVFNEQGNDADFRVESSSNDSAFFVDAGSSRIGMGTSTPQTDLDIERSGTAATITLSSYRDHSNHCKFDAYAYRGTLASPVTLNHGDAVWELRGLGYDGSVAQNVARILFTVDDTPVSGSKTPGRISFQTALTSSLVTRMRISKEGYVGINTTNPSSRLEVDGGDDVVQLLVQGHSTQTSDLVVFENSAGTDQITFSVSGGAIFNESGGSTDEFRVETGTGTDALHIDYANDTVGVFLDPASAPSKSLTVRGVPQQTNRYLFGINDSFTDTSGSQAGALFTINANPSGASTSSSFGLFLEAGTNTGNGQDITNNEALVGGKFKVNHRGTGTVSQSATILLTLANTGTITTAYGLFIDRHSKTGVTTPWGVYQSHADDHNYFASTVSIGSTTTGEKLLVEGAVQLDQIAAPSGTAGYGKVFVGTDERLKYIDATGSLAVPTGTINSNVTAVGNIGTGEDNLMTHTIVVTSHMGEDGDSLTIYASGKMNPTMSVTLKAYLGTTQIFSNNEAFSSTEWFCEIKILRIGQSDQVAYWQLNDTSGDITATTGVTALAENLASNKVFKFTGEDGGIGDNDTITQEYMTIIHNPTAL